MTPFLLPQSLTQVLFKACTVQWSSPSNVYIRMYKHLPPCSTNSCQTSTLCRYMAFCQIHRALQPSSLLKNLSRLLSSTGSLRNHSRMGTFVRALWTCSEADLTSRLSCKASL